MLPGTLDALDGAMHLVARVSGARLRTVRTPLGQVRFYDLASRGPLPTLVLVHGLGAGCAAQYAAWFFLARGVFRRVLAPDLPAHGGSPALPRMDAPSVYDAVAAGLDAVLDEPPLVYGNSLGGAVALSYGLKRPVSGLFLASPAGTPLPEPLLETLRQRLTVPTPSSARELLAALQGKPGAWSSLFAADVHARFARPPIRALVRSVRNAHGFAPDALRGLQAPTLLWWGQEERLLPPEMLDYFMRHLPARLERPEGVGHVPHVDAPLWTWRRLVQFARESVGQPEDQPSTVLRNASSAVTSGV
jgi:pimeloyl-ACP methyl ester carboxylesterase